MSQNYDFIIIGAGVVGLSIAYKLSHQQPNSKILILEKETQLGAHASGRNSGVLHSGLYYPPESLKAKMCVSGSRLLREFIQEHQLRFQHTGKIILPMKPEDDATLDFLKSRADQNGVQTKIIDQDEISELQKGASSLSGRALWSPQTAIFDSTQVLKEFSRSLSKNVELKYSEPFESYDFKTKSLLSSKASYSAGLFINCAGSYTEKIAQSFGLAQNFVSIPIKGVYRYLKKEIADKISRLLYPVPDLNLPFLGIHFTPSIHGKLSIGPSAVPAFGRENYSGIEGLEAAELPGRGLRLASLYFRNEQGFRKYVHQEIKTMSAAASVELAQKMFPEIQKQHLSGEVKVGIRPQLYDNSQKKMLMDFHIERGENSVHILNAISPAFTCSLSFAEYILQEVIGAK